MTIMDAIKFTVIVGIVVQIYLISLYFMARLKRRHSSFVLLILSSLFGLLYSGLTTASYFVEIPRDVATDMYRYGLFAFYPTVVFSVLGIRSLVKSYINSSQEIDSDNTPESSGWDN